MCFNQQIIASKIPSMIIGSASKYYIVNMDNVWDLFTPDQTKHQLLEKIAAKHPVLEEIITPDMLFLELSLWGNQTLPTKDQILQVIEALHIRQESGIESRANFSSPDLIINAAYGFQAYPEYDWVGALKYVRDPETPLIPAFKLMDDKIKAEQAERGYIVMGVFGKGDTPSFSYTDGLRNLTGSELVVTAPGDPQSLNGLLAWAAEHLKEANPVEFNVVYTSTQYTVNDEPMRYKFCVVDAKPWFVDTPALVQLVLPDTSNLLPGEASYDEMFVQNVELVRQSR